MGVPSCGRRAFLDPEDVQMNGIGSSSGPAVGCTSPQRTPAAGYSRYNTGPDGHVYAEALGRATRVRAAPGSRGGSQRGVADRPPR